MLEGVLERTLYPGFRRVDFRGKGRLRGRLPVADEGERIVGFPGGMRLRLELEESLQRDFLFGLYDRHELRLLRRFLAPGGDMLDVGAHIGMYTVAAALVLRDRGRALAFEPNPEARRQLEANLALNGCTNVIVSSQAVSDRAGEAVLHVPSTSDPSYSSLGEGRFAEGEPVAVETTTLDEAAVSRGLTPAFVKVDVEGGELAVLDGATRTIEAHRPVLLVEVGTESGRVLDERLGALGYGTHLVRRRGLEDGLGGATGTFNALFVPRERWTR
jgi:FkbM family methyltransferase